MIYLIDDKNLRQAHDYYWTEDRFKKYSDAIKPIYTLSELQEENKVVFQEGNIIIYHESFIDKTNIRVESAERRSALEKFRKQKNSYLVFFSGSINTRDLKENVANIPVSVMYSNLETFIKKYMEGDLNLKYLLFGCNPEIEEELSRRLNSEVFRTAQEPTYHTDKNILFVRPDEKYISRPFSKYVELIIFNNVKDSDFNEIILKSLDNEVYDGIFIPLCFGDTLSDYNGLRLACHIRCTESKNQTTRLFIYGIVSVDYLLQNEYFNILKTKNTFLISFSKQSFDEAFQKIHDLFVLEELPAELAKLKLDTPDDYFDNHHIANEWGIFQIARNADIDISEIEGFDKSKFDKVYFKWLIAINRLGNPIPDDQKEEQKQYAPRLQGLTIVGKIDPKKLNRK